MNALMYKNKGHWLPSSRQAELRGVYDRWLSPHRKSSSNKQYINICKCVSAWKDKGPYERCKVLAAPVDEMFE